MRLSIKEKVGIIDTSRIYEGLHLSEGFVKNTALFPENIELELKKEGERHFKICDKCRNKKDSYLPLGNE